MSDAGPAWTAKDIGTFVTPGKVTYSGDLITVAMQAGDLWNDADDFYFLYQPRTGDIEITALVASIDAGSEYGKAGVMIRQSLNPDSANAFVDMTFRHGYGFQLRDGGGALTGPGASDTATKAPHWVRLRREGGMLYGYQSVDGATFIQVNAFADPFTGPVYVGLAVSSQSFDAGNISQFRQVSIRVP